MNTEKTSVHKRRLPPVGFLLLCSFALEKYYFILFDAESTGLIYNEGREFLPTEKIKSGENAGEKLKKFFSCGHC